MPRYLVDLVDHCLDHGDLFGGYCGKTVGVVAPDGSVKRLPTIRIQVAIWTRYRGGDVDARDAWMLPKIDTTIAAFKQNRERSKS